MIAKWMFRCSIALLILACVVGIASCAKQDLPRVFTLEQIRDIKKCEKAFRESRYCNPAVGCEILIRDQGRVIRCTRR